MSAHADCVYQALSDVRWLILTACPDDAGLSWLKRINRRLERQYRIATDYADYR